MTPCFTLPIDKLPDGQVPIWIDRDETYSDFDILKMLKIKIFSEDVIVFQGKINIPLAHYCEEINWKYYPLIGIIIINNHGTYIEKYWSLY